MIDLAAHRLLIVEDSTEDAILMVHGLRKAGLKIKYDLVDTIALFEEAIIDTDYDAILCDHQLDHFNSLTVLMSLRHSTKTTPFIVISGIITENVGQQLLALGARNFLLKANLERLPELLMKVKEDKLYHGLRQ